MCIRDRYIEEVGAANFFCVKNDVLYTPELTGTILPGITRDSVIQLARSFGYKVIEEKVSAEFAMDADEAFCCGTAAVISPIGSIMHDGKKSISYSIFYDSLKLVEEKTKEKGLQVWKKALNKVMPSVEVKSRRVGGATFQIPMQIRPDRKVSLAMKWLISFSRKRNEKSMALKLAQEVIAAAKEEGAAVKKRVDTHKMAEANKAFSHFRF